MKQILLKTWLILVCLLTGAGTMWADKTYTKVTDASSLSANDVIILACDAKSSYAGAMGSNAYLTHVSSRSDAIEITLSGSSSGWTLTTSEGKIGATAAKKMSKTSGTTTWTISITNDDAIIQSTETSYGFIQYNAASPRFLNYASAQTAIQIYKVTEGSGSAPTALSAPTNLSSSNVTTTGATLSWDAVSNASSYTVKIGDTEYTNVTTTSYNATGLTAGTPYTWTVKAVGDGTNYSTSAYAANANFTTEAEQSGGEEPSGDALSVDFESETSAYSDWTFTNITTKQTNSNVSAHGGSYFGTTDGKATGSVQTTNKVNPATITFYISKTTTNTTSSNWKVQTSSNGTSWTDAKTVSASSVTRGEWTEVTHTFSNVSDVYVRVYYDGSTAVRCIDDLTLTLSEGGNTPGKTTPELSFANPIYNATMGAAFIAPTLNNPQEVTVSYSSSATGVATVNASTGAVTLVGAGTTTITASFDGSKSDTYNSNSASYQLVVAAEPVSTTFASLEELVAADLTSGTNVTVSFENVPIKSIYTSSQSKRTGVYFDIQKDGHDIEIYYSSTEVPAEWIEGGTLSGTMTNCPWTYYERGTTWELAPEKDSWAWTELNYTAPAAPVYNVNIAEVDNGTISANTYKAIEGTTITLTATPAEGYEFESWYVLDGEANEVTVANDQFAMPASDVEVSATFTPIQQGGNPESGDADATIVCKDVAWIESGEKNDAALSTTSGDYTVNIVKNTGSTNPTYINSEGNYDVRAYAKATITISSTTKQFTSVVFNISTQGLKRLAPITANCGTIQAQASGDKTVTWSSTTPVSSVTFTVGDNANYGTDGSSKAGQLDFVSISISEATTPEPESNTLTLVAQDSKGDYYATFSANKDVIFLANSLVEVKTVFTDGEEILLETLSDKSWAMVDGVEATESYGYYVPANTGVLICSEEATVNYYNVAAYEYNQNESNFSDNMLRAASVAMEAEGYKFYKLAYNNYTYKTGLGFYWGAENGAAFTAKAGGAYLAVPVDVVGNSNVRGFSFDFEGRPTGIESIGNEVVAGEIYNLQGQRINRLQQGVNIVNGRKVIR